MKTHWCQARHIVGTGKANQWPDDASLTGHIRRHGQRTSLRTMRLRQGRSAQDAKRLSALHAGPSPRPAAPACDLHRPHEACRQKVPSTALRYGHQRVFGRGAQTPAPQVASDV